jgi:hypothetical protein
MRPIDLPNVPVIRMPTPPTRPMPKVQVEKCKEPAPKTKPSYGMALPYMKGVSGVPLLFRAG